MDYTLNIRPADTKEWDTVMQLLTVMQVTNVIIEDDVIHISANPVTLARILSVIAGALYEE